MKCVRVTQIVVLYHERRGRAAAVVRSRGVCIRVQGIHGVNNNRIVISAYINKKSQPPVVRETVTTNGRGGERAPLLRAAKRRHVALETRVRRRILRFTHPFAVIGSSCRHFCKPHVRPTFSLTHILL